MRHFVVLLIAFLSFSANAYIEGEMRDKGYFVSFRYAAYSDIPLGDAEPVDMPPAYGVELGFRLYNPYSLVLAAERATDSSRDVAGFGFRVDLPGVFFVGKSREDLFRNSKAYPWNSSIYGLMQVAFIKNPGEPDSQTFATKIGTTLEAFVINDNFVVLDLALFNLAGNTFVNASAGFGVEF